MEYAIEAINNAGTCVGLQSTDGIILAAERKVVSKLLAPSKTSEKTYVIDDHIVCLVAGLTSDANILINQSRLGSQRLTHKFKLLQKNPIICFFSFTKRYLYKYQEQMPVEQVVKSICNYKQAYTQYGGLRPFGVAFLFAGWDRNFGFQLYQTDPSGNYSGWKATVIGQNNQAGKSILKTDYSENNDLAKNLKIAVKILLKTMDSSTPSPERIELSTITRNEDGDILHVTLKDAQVMVTTLHIMTFELFVIF